MLLSFFSTVQLRQKNKWFGFFRFRYGWFYCLNVNHSIIAYETDSFSPFALLLSSMVVLLQHHLLSILKTTVYVNVMLMASFPYATGSHCRQVTIFPENVRFGNMWIITWISKVSRLPMASSTSPFTYEAVEVIFGSIYFYFHIQTAPNLQDCPHSDNLTTFPDFTLLLYLLNAFNFVRPFLGTSKHDPLVWILIIHLHYW